jgi:hypothetical protein
MSGCGHAGTWTQLGGPKRGRATGCGAARHATYGCGHRASAITEAWQSPSADLEGEDPERSAVSKTLLDEPFCLAPDAHAVPTETRHKNESTLMGVGRLPVELAHTACTRVSYFPTSSMRRGRAG